MRSRPYLFFLGWLLWRSSQQVCFAVDDFWKLPVQLDAWPPAALPARTTEDTVKAIQADVRYIVSHTGVLVYVEGPQADKIGLLFNTRRGQKFPTGTTEATGGHTIEFRDLGCPQPGAPEMTLMEAAATLYANLRTLGLEMVLR